MWFYLVLPILFLRFWYLEAPIGLIRYFSSFNHAFLQMFSLGLLVKTFFKPWKNEYREGLIGFSQAMGMFIKSIVITIDILLLIVFLVIELVLFLAFVLLPIASFFILLNKYA